MLSNVKKKDVPLIAISLAAIVFIAATLSLFPQQTAQAADSIFNGVTRLLGSTVQVLVLLALGQWSVFLSAEGIALWPLALVPVASRACAALAVLTLRPMTTSQYSAMERGGAPVVFAALVLAAACITAALVWGSFAPLAAAAVYALAAWYGVKQLGGMSGDVSGFALTLAELGGAAALVLWR